MVLWSSVFIKHSQPASLNFFISGNKTPSVGIGISFFIVGFGIKIASIILKCNKMDYVKRPGRNFLKVKLVGKSIFDYAKAPKDVL